MADVTTNPGTGSRVCEAVRYRLAEAPTRCGARHCAMGRKFSDGIEPGLEMPPGGIAWEAGENIQTHTASDRAERGFAEFVARAASGGAPWRAR